jgi:glycosyltransferase involved in cell wall biosynthesis
MAKVSVVVPLYNTENYVARAIDSVLAQTFQDFELIVVDDGSTDSGPDLVRKYQDPRVKYYSQSNRGPGAARNRGIKESTSPYVSFLDADDEWLPDFLQKYLEALMRNPECDYVVGPYFEGVQQIDKSKNWTDMGLREGPWSLPLDVTHEDLHRFLTVLHFTGAMLCKRSVLEKHHGFYSKDECRYGEDRYLQMQLLLNHRLYLIVEPLVWYHSETAGISSIGTGPRPITPLLTDPMPIRKSCPPSFRSVLEKYLASHAMGYAMEWAKAGEFYIAKDLIFRFPAMMRSARMFVRLIGAMTVSKLNGSVRS